MAVTNHALSPEQVLAFLLGATDTNSVKIIAARWQYNYPSKSSSGEAASMSDVFCSTDYTKCPIGWDQNGSVCSAKSTYSGDLTIMMQRETMCLTRAANESTGPCPHDLDFSTMTLDEKQGLASFCKVKFPCQVEPLSGASFTFIV